MNMLKRTLALMLVLCMMLSAVPFTAFTTESTDEPSTPAETPVDAPESEDPVVDEPADDEEVVEASQSRAVSATSTSDFIKVFHLDCGRKYFTVDQIKELIDALSAVGFSHMELAIGNDGLRLLLDDMSIEANGTTYASDTVKSGIQTGNSDYSHSGEWTEAEMDTIIAYAKTKGIEIIPLVNNPGHMDSILAAMSACGINGYYASSARTVDLENAEAVAFTQALVLKYAKYFANKGCNYFNIGADEYANDYHTADSTGMGFGYLIDNNMYGNFITYVNTLVAGICDLDMTPIAFNDGIYFRENTKFGTFDTRLVVAAWTGGWGGIKPASTSFLQSKGHQILNTNERWYYVLGRAQASNSTYCYESALSNAKSESVTTVTDHKTGVTSMGAMQCVWCDVPSVNYETYKSNVMTLINTLAENNPTYFTGPNEVTPEPEEPETVTKTDEATKVEITAPGLETVEVKENAAVVTEEKVSKTYSITLNGGAYTEAATVKIPYDTAFDGCNAFTGFVDGDEFPVTKDGEYFLCEVPHFSDVEIEGRAVAEDSIIAGTGTAASYVLDTNGLDDGAQYLIVYNNNALTNAKGSLAVTISDSNATPTSDASAALWTYTVEEGWISNSYYLTNGSNYLYPTRSGSSGNRVYTLNIGATKTSITINNRNNGTYRVSNTNGNSYVAYTSNGWGAQNSYQNLSFYKYTEGTQTYSVDAALQESRIAAATVANDGYTEETWKAYQTALKAAQDKLAEVEAASYSSQSNANIALDELIAAVDALEEAKEALAKARTITVNYQEDGVTVGSAELNIPADATTYELPGTVAFNGVSYTVDPTTLSITADDIYNVAVIEIPFDPSTVTPLTVEYWITNIVTRTVESNTSNPVTTQQISAAAEGVVTANGADINAMMPEWTVKRDGDSGADREVEFWHVRLLDKTQTNNSTSGTEQQTTDSADDETTNGDAVTRVRYYDPGDGNGRRWQMLSGTTWLDVTANSQIVAYYMEVIDIQNANGSTELHVNAADWGKLGDGSPASSYADTSKYCSISLQIVYEDGSGNPATTTAADLDSKTLIFNYWDNGRGIGTFAFDTLGQFNIYQITAETGAVSVSFSGGAWGTAQVNSFTWDNNEKVVWSGESETASIYNNTSHPTSEDPKDNLMWNENKEAILIRVYVRAVETEDSLKVVYYDEKFGDTLYSYNIQVEKDYNFTNNMIGTPETLANGRIDVTGCGIKNSYGQTQNFQTNLTQVPEAKGKYNSALYTYTGSEIKDDGKTLYLYYNINTSVLSPNFVVDFGLPLTFELDALLGEGTETSEVTAVSGLSARYGTLTYSSGTFTYTPTAVLQNIDVLSITLTFDHGESALTNVGVTPATTVYYGEQFLNFSDNWTAVGSYANPGEQKAEVLGESTHYGYDAAYANTTGASDGTARKSETIGDTATFTFTGIGIQVFANSAEGFGYVSVTVKNKDTGAITNVSMVDTDLKGTAGTETTGGQIGKNLSGLPVVSLVNLTGLQHGTYEVTITKVMDTDPVYIDGIRVFGTLDESKYNQNNNPFTADEEDAPDFYEVRDLVMKAIGIQASESVDYKTMFNQIYADTVEVGSSAVITSANAEYGTMNRQDLLDNGPKNELYLFNGDTLTLKVSTNRVIQLGLKAPEGSASFTLNGAEKSLSSTVDMFYKIAEKGGSTHTITITNTGDKILSVTLLKVCDDPNFAFAPLTEENIKAILADAGYTDGTETPVEPEVPETEPTEPEVEETKPSKPGKPGNNGNNKPGNNKPGNNKPGNNKPGNNGNNKPAQNNSNKKATLKITYVNLFGRKVDTATLVETGTANERCLFSVSEIGAEAPAGKFVMWFLPIIVSYGDSMTIVVPVI